MQNFNPSNHPNPLSCGPRVLMVLNNNKKRHLFFFNLMVSGWIEVSNLGFWRITGKLDCTVLLEHFIFFGVYACVDG